MMEVNSLKKIAILLIVCVATVMSGCDSDVRLLDTVPADAAAVVAVNAVRLNEDLDGVRNGGKLTAGETLDRLLVNSTDRAKNKILDVSFKNLILSLVCSKLSSCFNNLTRNSTKEMASSTHFSKRSGPYLTIYSSGSFAPVICKMRISQPRFCKISSPRKVAACPAPSAS